MKNITPINAHTALYCIFGNPVKHSLSPAMQNAAFSALGINAVYMAFEVDSIKHAVHTMKALGIRGASVTIPYKEEVMEHIDKIDPLAKEIGSVNTLKNVNGKIYGYNTDGYGAVQALSNNGVRVKRANILLLGNGGSARAISYSLLKEKANVTIAGRNRENILRLVNDIKKKHKNIDHILIADIDENFMDDTDVVINTTPVGMSPDTDRTPLPQELILKRHTVFDIVYSPGMTKLLKTGRKKGCKIIYGIEMLLNQGARQFEIWTGKKAPVEVMRKAIKNNLPD